ncbi:MAG: hypothetical protein KF805_12530 [Phycisphaeraceae bacterium]|nr:hypothetical protein [Phycisphaeraceae bacterium]
MSVLSMDARAAIVLEEVTRSRVAAEDRAEAWMAANTVAMKFVGNSAKRFRYTVRRAIRCRAIDVKRKHGMYGQGSTVRASASDSLDHVPERRAALSPSHELRLRSLLLDAPEPVRLVLLYFIRHGSLRGLNAKLTRAAEARLGCGPTKTRGIVPSQTNLNRMLADVRRCAQGQMSWHALHTDNRQPQSQRRRSSPQRTAGRTGSDAEVLP